MLNVIKKIVWDAQGNCVLINVSEVYVKDVTLNHVNTQVVLLWIVAETWQVSFNKFNTKECGKCKKTSCEKHLKKCIKCNEYKCISCSPFKMLSCSHNVCESCKFTSCSICTKGDCCGSQVGCTECKKLVCESSCLKKCFKCQKKYCLGCIKNGTYFILGNYRVIDLCIGCNQTSTCFYSQCSSLDIEGGFINCHDCKKRFCQKHAYKCNGCNNIYCKSFKKEVLNNNQYCNNCSTSRDHLDFKLHDLETCFSNEDFRKLKIDGMIQATPMIMVKDKMIAYPTHFMSSEHLKQIKVYLKEKKPKIEISSSFEETLNDKLYLHINNSLYSEKAILRFAFEKLIVLEKDEEIKNRSFPSSYDNHIGNLLIFLPSVYTGGSVSVLFPDTKKDDFDFSMKKDLTLHWIGFQPKMQFSVSKIESGNCIILYYKILHEGLREIQLPDMSIIPKAKKLLDDIFSIESISSKNKIGYILTNRYDSYDRKTALSGKDLNIYNVLNSIEQYHVKIQEFEVEKTRVDYDDEYKIINTNFLIINEGRIRLSRYDNAYYSRKFTHGMLVISNSKRKREDSDDEEDVSIIEVPEKKSTKCPISKCRMEDPVKSKNCGHSYDKTSILCYLSERRRECPISGCQKYVSFDDLIIDFEMREFLKNEPNSDEDEKPKEKESLQESTLMENEEEDEREEDNQIVSLEEILKEDEIVRFDSPKETEFPQEPTLIDEIIPIEEITTREEIPRVELPKEDEIISKEIPKENEIIPEEPVRENIQEENPKDSSFNVEPQKEITNNGLQSENLFQSIEFTIPKDKDEIDPSQEKPVSEEISLDTDIIPNDSISLLLIDDQPPFILALKQ